MANTQEPQFTTMRVHPDSVEKLKVGEALFQKKNRVKPTHSDAVRMAVDAWLRELKAA